MKRQVEKIVRTIPAATVVQFSPLAVTIETAGVGEISEPNHSTPHTTAFGTTPDLITSTIERAFAETGDTFHRTLSSSDNGWSPQMDSRFDALVTKEAVGKISASELSELDLLQKRRRLHLSPPSGEEILRRHKREKLDLQLLTLLRKNVRVHSLSTYSA